jgi:addiction module RelE/StbE family toxin
MAKIRWTAIAREDLRQIRAYIARDSRTYAARMIQRIRSAARACRRFPLASPRVEEWDRDDLRETYVGSYRVIYHVDGGVITVLTVIHSARRLPPLDSVRREGP